MKITSGVIRFNLRYIAIVLLVLIVQVACTSDDKIGAFEKTGASTFVEFYSTQSKYTDPGKYVYLYQGIPTDVAEIVAIVQGVILNLARIENENIQLSRRRISRDINLNTVGSILKNISRMDDRPLTGSRPLQKRTVGICAHFAMLTCSILRHHRVAARCRGGFENYFSATRHHDHWICEYWHTGEDRWVRIDPEINDAMRTGLNIGFDSLDLPQGTFLTGVDVWRNCRSGDAVPGHFGISGSEWIGGWDFVLNELVLDFMALNKVELLPWDGNRLSEKNIRRLRDDEFELLDLVVELVGRGNTAFREIRQLYLENKKIQK